MRQEANSTLDNVVEVALFAIPAALGALQARAGYYPSQRRKQHERQERKRNSQKAAERLARARNGDFDWK